LDLASVIYSTMFDRKLRLRPAAYIRALKHFGRLHTTSRALAAPLTICNSSTGASSTIASRSPSVIDREDDFYMLH